MTKKNKEKETPEKNPLKEEDINEYSLQNEDKSEAKEGIGKEKNIEELEKEVLIAKDEKLRLLADMENLRKRFDKEKLKGKFLYPTRIIILKLIIFCGHILITNYFNLI